MRHHPCHDGMFHLLHTVVSHPIYSAKDHHLYWGGAMQFKVTIVIFCGAQAHCEEEQNQISTQFVFHKTLLERNKSPHNAGGKCCKLGMAFMVFMTLYNNGLKLYTKGFLQRFKQNISKCL